MIERSQVRLVADEFLSSLGQLSLPSLWVGKPSTSLLAGVKTGPVHLCPVAGKTVILYGR